jgi:hypothetical protein
MTPRSLLLNAVALVGIFAWMTGAPRLVFGSDAGATIQPSPSGQPVVTRAPRRAIYMLEGPPVETIQEVKGGSKLIVIRPEEPEEGAFGCAHRPGEVRGAYYAVETQVYDRKTRRPIKDKTVTRRVPERPVGMTYAEATDKAFAERQFGEWDDGKPLTAEEWQRFAPR